MKHTIPIPRVFIVDTSVIIAILSDTFPLLIPPKNLASIKIAKFVDSAQSTYDNIIPNCKSNS